MTNFSLSPVSAPDGHRRPEVLRAQYRYGLFYGVMVGLLFAAVAWGVDAVLLYSANGVQPWLKLIVGALVCAPVGGLAGWLTMRFERALLAVPFWVIAGAVFAGMTVILPMQIFPRLLVMLEPDLEGLISFFMAEVLIARFWVSFVWVAIFVTLAGVLEIPMGQPAAFSTSVMGKLAPVLLCGVLMVIGGMVVDSDNNKPLRAAVIAMDDTLQFALEHQGQEIDAKVSRELHLASLRHITDLIGQPRELIIGKFDRYLDQVHVIIRFDGEILVDCLTVSDQPISCERVEP
ncbi:MAG: hypothetical protein HY869_04850 [Chloroflexi bacterium]|nr:hypothetical protein [Chloroflexota bacterium]